MFLQKRTERHGIFLLILMFGLLTFYAGPTRAQTLTSAPAADERNEEEKKLEEKKRILLLQKEIAVAEKDIAEAQKLELAAKYPAPSSSPLAGDTKINDGALIEGQMVAYAALGRAGNRIVKGIKANKIAVSNLAIFNEEDVNLLVSYKVANNQIEIIRQGYCTLLKTPQAIANCPTNNAAPLLAMTIARSFLGAFVDMTSMLRTNVEIKGSTFSIDEGPLVAEVFRAARRTDGFGTSVNLYYPAMFPPDINPNANSSILTKLDAVNILRTEAGRLIGGIEKKAAEVEESKGKIKSLKGSIKQSEDQKTDAMARKARLWQAYCAKPSKQATANQDKPCGQMPPVARERFLEILDEITKLDNNLNKQKNDLATEETNLVTLNDQLKALWDGINAAKNNYAADDAFAQLKARNAQFDKFVESLVTASGGTGVNPLTNYIKAENLKNSLPSGSHWLQLRVINAGGNNRVKTNLIWDLFTGGNRLSHSGGVIIEYILFDDTGKSLASDTITEYSKYMKSSKVKTLPNTSVDEVTY